MDWLRKLLFWKKPSEAVFDSPPLLQALPVIQTSPVTQFPTLRVAPSTSSIGASLPALTQPPALPGFQNASSELGFSAIGDAGVRNKVRDAFSPSLPITDPRLLAGRTETLQTLIRAIEDLKVHVVIYGERGIGKTSLLQILKQLAEQAKYQVVYHSCGEDAEFAPMFRAIAGEIPLLYYQGFAAAGDDMRRGGSLASLLPPGDFNVSQLSDTFSQLTNTRVIIMLDEFDRSPPGLFRRSIAQLVKNLSDRSVKVQLVISGVAGNLADLIEHIPSIRRNIQGYRVPELQPAEVQQMVAIGETISGLTFAPAAREDIVTMANGSPYLASLLSQYASFGALDRGGAEVATNDVRRATARVADELRTRLSEASGDAIDRALADGQDDTLLVLANTAMHQMGGLDGDRLDPSFDDGGFVATAETLRAKYALLDPAFEEKPGRYRFREEGIASYIWLHLAEFAPIPEPAE